MPVLTPGSHNKERGLCHLRLERGVALGGAGTSTMGIGQTGSPPLAEGGEHITALGKWTSLCRPRGCLQGWTARVALDWPWICLTPNIWCGGFLLHTLLFDRGGDVALRARGDPVNPGACSGCWRLWDRQRDAPKVGPAPCSTVRSGYVPPTPFTYYGRGSSFSTGDVPAYLS